MITEFDLEETIAKYQGIVNPTTNDCIKLAALYTVRNELFPKEKEPTTPAYSFAPPPEKQTENTISYDSGTEFSDTIHGRDPNEVWTIMDDLMNVLRSINPKLYDATMFELEK